VRSTCSVPRLSIVRHARVPAGNPGADRDGRNGARAEDSRPAGLPRRAIGAFRDGGLGAAASKAAGALWTHGAVEVFEMQAARVRDRAAVVPGVTVRLLEDGDLATYTTSQPSSAEMVEARLRRGDRCVVAVDGGRVLGSRWATTASADIGDLWLSFPVCAGVAYTYDAFTLPEARGGGIGAAITAALFERVVADGANRVINAVLPDNPAGQGLARRRSEPLGVLRSNRLGDWRVARCRIPAGYLGPPRPFVGNVPAQQP
jgi:GNAT superfamily N-acetyltransferase